MLQCGKEVLIHKVQRRENINKDIIKISVLWSSPTITLFTTTPQYTTNKEHNKF
jgi:hypothetical protein